MILFLPSRLKGRKVKRIERERERERWGDREGERRGGREGGKQGMYSAYGSMGQRSLSELRESVL